MSSTYIDTIDLGGLELISNCNNEISLKREITKKRCKVNRNSINKRDIFGRILLGNNKIVTTPCGKDEVCVDKDGQIIDPKDIKKGIFMTNRKSGKCVNVNIYGVRDIVYKASIIGMPPYNSSKNLVCRPLKEIGIDFEKMNTFEPTILGAGSYNIAYDISYDKQKLAFRITKNKSMIQKEQIGLMYQTLLCKRVTEGGYGCPNICNIYDFGIYRIIDEREFSEKFPDIPESILYKDYYGVYAIMEKIEGGELRERMSKISISDSILLIKNVLKSLECMHIKNIVHLDLKPENIMMMYDEKSDNKNKNTDIRLIDFGLASKVDSYISYRGSPPYVSPNIIKIINFNDDEIGDIKANYYDDIWSLGIIFIELLTSERFINNNFDIIKSWEKDESKKYLIFRESKEIGRKPNKETWLRLKRVSRLGPYDGIIDFLKKMFGWNEDSNDIDLMKIPKASELLDDEIFKNVEESRSKVKKPSTIKSSILVKESKLSAGKKLKKSRRCLRKLNIIKKSRKKSK